MLRALFSKAYSQIFIVGDNAGWVIDDEAKLLKNTLDTLSIPAKIVRRSPWNLPQVVHYMSQFSLIDENIYKSKHRISVDYFHGKPEQQESFRLCFEALRKHHSQIVRVRVSNKEMESVIKSSGIDPTKVRLIHIGVDTKKFTPQTAEKKRLERTRLGIPEEAVVIGSFQKDGTGWGEGNEPKLIKGPDIFLKVVHRLRRDIPNLYVLLSGPARGFVKKGLEAMGVPYKHEYLEDPEKVANLYDALDLYIVASREEGGPKACLDSMAKGVPLVTAAVGQCKDLVVDGVNGLIAPIEDVDALYKKTLEIVKDKALKEQLIKAGIDTARANSLVAQTDLWQEYFKGLVN